MGEAPKPRYHQSHRNNRGKSVAGRRLMSDEPFGDFHDEISPEQCTQNALPAHGARHHSRAPARPPDFCGQIHGAGAEKPSSDACRENYR